MRIFSYCFKNFKIRLAVASCVKNHLKILAYTKEMYKMWTFPSVM